MMLCVKRTLNLLIASGYVLIIAMLSLAQTALVKKDRNGTVVEVDLGSEISPTSGPTGGLFLFPKDGPPTLLTGVSAAIINSPGRFRLNFPSAGPQYDPAATYKVVLFIPVTNQLGRGDLLPKTIDVQRPLELSILRGKLVCTQGATLRIQSHTKEGEKYPWQPVFAYLDSFSLNQRDLATIRIKKENDVSSMEYPVIGFSYKKAPVRVSNELLLCLETGRYMPAEKFTAEITLNPTGIPTDLVETATQPNLPASILVPAPKDEELKSPDARKIERNLDLGITFTSSVADVDLPATATTPAIHKRERTSRGVMDLRLAPWTNVLHPIIDDNKWITFLTPVFINANVATGRIVKNTLSMNRILFGFEGESRYYWAKEIKGITTDQDRIVYPIWHRVIWGMTHASDRDFKQDEITGKLEYDPIFPALFKPISLNYTTQGSRKIFKPLGYTLKPKAGFEFGKTYHRENPAKDLPLSKDTIRRLYFGAEVAVDVTRYLNLSVADTYYIRYESEKDRYKNYFKGQITAPIIATPSTSHSLFFVFERGALAPFNSPSVNSVRIGYRVIGDFCTFYCR
jgi:hypothetical protein